MAIASGKNAMEQRSRDVLTNAVQYFGGGWQ